jgi:hypothetical protein
MQSPFEDQLTEQIEAVARDSYQEQGRGALIVIDDADDRHLELFYISALDIQQRTIGELVASDLEQQLATYDPTTHYILVLLEPDEQRSIAGGALEANQKIYLVGYKNRVPFARTA